MKLFISYARQDESFVRQLATTLLDAGADVWLDVEDIPAGTKWSSAIQQALDTCDGMLVVISPDSMTSRNVEDEWQYYLDDAKPVIPILLQPSKIHFQLRRIQYVDFHTLEYPTAFSQLLAELDRQGVSVDKALTPAMPSSLPALDSILPPPFEWIDIPAGTVTLEEGGYLKEKTIFDVPAIKIAKYPITDDQYQVFVDSVDGYSNPSWWDYSDAAKDWRSRRNHPAAFEATGTNLPRTGIAWYEAVAFCRWLTSQVYGRSNAELSAVSPMISLPTEQQWQRAGQGDDRRDYPWGNSFDKDRCNMRLSGIQQPSPVNQFEGLGDSLFGVVDMSGNVWEWCLTDYHSGSQSIDHSSIRSLRGGSYSSGKYFTRVAHRAGNDPYNRDDKFGFRIAMVIP